MNRFFFGPAEHRVETSPTLEQSGFDCCLVVTPRSPNRYANGEAPLHLVTNILALRPTDAGQEVLDVSTSALCGCVRCDPHHRPPGRRRSSGPRASGREIWAPTSTGARPSGGHWISAGTHP